MPVLSLILDSPRSALTTLFDDFIVDGCRVRLLGSTLEVEVPEDRTEEEARRLADRYVGLLRSGGIFLRLFTLEDYSGLLPQPVYAVGPDQVGQMLAVSARRSARNALLAGSNDALRRCYELRDTMADEPVHALDHAYNLIEILRDEFGNEAALIRALGMKAEIEYVKGAANDPTVGGRHATRKKSKRNAPPRPFDRAIALRYTEDILHAYERYLRP